MNKRYHSLLQQGYQTTGITARPWDKDELPEKAKKYKVMGNKVAIVQKIDTSSRRGGGLDRYEYWQVMVLKSDEYKAWEKAEFERKRKESREWELRRMADTVTLEELAWMIKDKVDRMHDAAAAEAAAV